jgi:hypothetical protein
MFETERPKIVASAPQSAQDAFAGVGWATGTRKRTLGAETARRRFCSTARKPVSDVTDRSRHLATAWP